ncbi:MAG: M23 family metallopeptidase [Thermodesulfobacteriota bacterium]
MRVNASLNKGPCKSYGGRSAFLKVLFLSTILISLNSCITLKGLNLDYSDNRLTQGGLALAHLSGARGEDPITGTFNGGETLIVKTDKGGAWAIVAADLESEPGRYHLIFKKGNKRISSAIRLVSGDFGTDRISLPADKVEFDEATLLRIEKERKIIEGVLGTSAKRRLWNKAFIMPLTGRISGAFGQRRILNGSPRSPHGGLDIAAPGGTPVLASGGGCVVFTGNFFFYGNLVVIDHGLGLFTLYAHLSTINVKKGEAVKAGQVIGLVGATGRATGPHLHFAIRLGRARLSPRAFIDLTARLARLLAGDSIRGAGQAR